MKMLADQPWCAAAASATRATATHIEDALEVKTMGTTQSAQISMAVFRAALTLKPRRIREPKSQPPPTLPTDATT